LENVIPITCRYDILKMMSNFTHYFRMFLIYVKLLNVKFT
jgi:hypothetical protein